MCGIGGIYFAEQRDEALLEDRAREICSTLRHRGPDDAGTWIGPGEGMALAHTRLAIIDLSPNGHQPMVSQDGRWVMVYNGEIYNYRILSDELGSRGVALRGHSDTETILEYVARFGLRATLDKANGMFALALWDTVDRKLYLARDRVGIKPLYYGRVNGTWLFGSELKALVRLPERPREIEPDALAAFMRHGYIPDHLCIFKGIHKVTPGSIVTISGQAVEPEIAQFWSLSRDTIDDELADETAAADRLQDLLRTSVERRMLADVPVGAFLSGGVDSSLIAAIMQEQNDTPIQTFTIGFDEPQFDESDIARQVAARLGTRHTELTATAADALEMVDDLASVYDEPFADGSMLPTLMVSKLAAEHVKVVLSGDGGDELFAGYSRYRRIEERRRTLGRAPRWAAGPLRTLVKLPLWSEARRTAGSRMAAMLAARSQAELYRAAVSIVPEPGRFVPGSTDVPQPILNDDEASQPLLQTMMWIDFHSYLPADILTKVDRASMSVGLEARVPLLDHEVAELAWQPSMLRFAASGQPKALLRRVLYRYLDAELFARPKSGFAIPVAAWLRGPLRDWADGLVNSGACSDLLDYAAVRSAWSGLQDGQDNQANIAWNVLMFLSWYGAWCAE